ncbi:MAG: metallopeptidase TldD-related protein [Planctomycetota bacterium]|nr:metallopeptidase TldD-related protein [Planctomycetota bacterium]
MQRGPDSAGTLSNFGGLGRVGLRGVALLAPLLLVAIIASSVAAAEGDLEGDILHKAMRDEMNRSMARLKMDDLESPYYLEYTVSDSSSESVSAAFGGLTWTGKRRWRRLATDLRVGDYTFDNTNFQGGRNRGSASLVIEDNYDAIRHSIWLATDQAYKAAVEVFASKQAVVKRQNLGELPDDFTRAEQHEYVAEPLKLTVDRKEWEQRVKRLSAIFREFPGIQDSSVSWGASVTNQYFVNSEGFQNRWGDGRVSLTARAETQAEDGMALADSVTFRSALDKGLPAEEEMAEKIRDLAKGLTARAEARGPEDYTGPVLLTGGASAQFFQQLLLQNLTNPRTPLFRDEGGARRFRGPRLVKRLGKRILPKTYRVIDDPTIDEWEGQALLGSYPVDDEGLAPQKVSLVEGGKLKNLLMSRVPTESTTGSNGHGRGVGRSIGSPTNVIIQSSEPVSEEDLLAALRELCEDEGLEYGIVVRKNFSSGRSRGSHRMAAYRVYAEDGRVEPSRGLTFDGVTISLLKDIEASGESKRATHFSSGSVSVVAPSILIEEMDLRKPPPQTEKGRYLRHPAFE